MSLGCCSLAPLAVLAQDPFLEGVRTTEPLAPEEEQKSFKLPAGFEIQLVAAEPEIQKPLNMQFDAYGRLWLTDTVEYPYAAPLDKPGRDSIKVLSDFGADGKAGKITTFADGLNIPIGIYPYRDGAIAYSIPNVFRFYDEDGDGKSERREKLFGPFDFTRDTHGMNNAFRRGFDGWLYACHGFNNVSNVAGADGHAISMASGNTYRMRVDGSRIEHFTHGQVNPFGMTIDPLGNLFTADCHSKPIYALLRDGQYPGFGRPHDGLGFVEPIMQHLHDSTAIGGIAVYAAKQFPAEFRGNMFTGNVMTSRVNRDSFEYRGSTIVAHEEPDFLATTDPWFRPVDIQLGPDGALYIADFYNRIIGHYEVSLEHPGRDRDRGRIWRIIYAGAESASDNVAPPAPLSTLPTFADGAPANVAETLVQRLGDDNLAIRMLAADALVDRHGELAIEPVRAALASDSALRRAHALWVLHRLNSLSRETLLAAIDDGDALVRTHALKALAESSDWSPALREAAIARLMDDDAFVRRAAAEALGQSPAIESAAPILTLIESTPKEDSHLRYVGLRTLSNLLRDDEVFAAIRKSEWSNAQRKLIAAAALTVPSGDAAEFLLESLATSDRQRGDELLAQVRHVARYLPASRSPEIAQIARERFANDIDLQAELLAAVVVGLKAQGVEPASDIREWGMGLARQAFAGDEASLWKNSPIAGKPRIDNPWVLETRESADGDSDSVFLGSLPKGEQLTGVLRSATFEIPPRLSFFVAGHIGAPDQPVKAMNFVRLRDSTTNEVLAETTPPRNDVAQKVEWRLEEFAGRLGYLEIVDGDQRGAYAWLAAGRFDPPVAKMPSVAPSVAASRRQAAAALAAEWKLSELSPALVASLVDPFCEPAVQESCAQAIARLRQDVRAAALAPLLADVETPQALREQICRAVANGEAEMLDEAASQAMRTAPRRLQESFAQALAGDRAGAELLLGLVGEGKASPRLLVQPAVRERLLATSIENVADRLGELTASLPSEDETLRGLIDGRRRAFASSERSSAQGAAVFKKNCAVCHQLKGEGPLIGPQLDGIGNRGLSRLLEDMLDPNRNVDAAFRTTTITTSDGRVLTGLVRREEGESLVLADDKGKEFSVSASDIEEQAKSSLSLMPQNVAQTMPEGEFHDLMAFLLEQTGAGK